MEARLKQELPVLDVIPQDLVDGYRSFDLNRNDCLGAKGQIIGFGHIIGCRERQLMTAMETIATLRADASKAAEELAGVRNHRDDLVLKIECLNALIDGLRQTIDQERADLVRERERQQDLRPFVQHKGACPAGWPNTCVCAHARTQHFDHSGTACAHCSCKKFTVGECSCGLAALLEPQPAPAPTPEEDWKSGEQPRFVMTGGSLWDNQEQCFWKRIESDE